MPRAPAGRPWWTSVIDMRDQLRPRRWPRLAARRGRATTAAGLAIAALLVVVTASAIEAIEPSAASAAHASSTPAPATSAPRRVVTLNLCADQLVVQLVDRSRIAAVTWLALDPVSSAVAEEAATLRTTYGTAEEVVRLHPDLVIAGRFTTRATVALLKRFGYRVMEIDTPESFEQIEAQVLQVADALGAQASGARVVADMRARLARVRAATDADARARGGAPAPLAAIFGSNGVTQGRGTLMDEVIRASGLRNLAADIGVRGFGQLSLERLVLARPDVIVLPGLGNRPLSVGQQLLVHPALASTRARTVHVPGKWTACGGPLTVNAVEYLHQSMSARAPDPASTTPLPAIATREARTR